MNAEIHPDRKTKTSKTASQKNEAKNARVPNYLNIDSMFGRAGTQAFSFLAWLRQIAREEYLKDKARQRDR